MIVSAIFVIFTSKNAATLLPRLATLRVLAPLHEIFKKPPFRVVPKYLVRAKGLEPSTSTLARLRSSQLSYARICVVYFYIQKIILQVKNIPHKNRPRNAINQNHFHGCNTFNMLIAVRLSANACPHRGHTINGAMVALYFLYINSHIYSPTAHAAITKPHAT